MTLVGWVQIALVLALVLGCSIPLSKFFVHVYAGERNFLTRSSGRSNAASTAWPASIRRASRTGSSIRSRCWSFPSPGSSSSTGSSGCKASLPLNPRGFDAVAPDLAFNTSISFITNTNWQSYSGETTMSHLTQMLGLTVHNFVSAATGIAMAFALVRGFARSSATTLGNFWADLTRITLYILLPIAFVVAVLLIALGRAADAHRRNRRNHARGREADDFDRSDGEPGDH